MTVTVTICRFEDAPLKYLLTVQTNYENIHAVVNASRYLLQIANMPVKINPGESIILHYYNLSELFLIMGSNETSHQVATQLMDSLLAYIEEKEDTTE